MPVASRHTVAAPHQRGAAPPRARAPHGRGAAPPHGAPPHQRGGAAGPARRTHRRRIRWRRRVVATVLLTTAGLVGAYLFDSRPSNPPDGAGPPPEARAASPEPIPNRPHQRDRSVRAIEGVTDEPPVLSLPGDFPADGPGTVSFAATEGDVLGEAGTLRRLRVGVEDGIDEDVDEFAGFVDDTLGDERSWTAGGLTRFQRVPGDAGHDFTVYLVTGETAAQMCAEAGLDIRGSDGVPYTSCRTPGRVIINLNRWRLSVPDYVDGQVPLDAYRRMVLNHEVGHELGLDHERCPGEGEPAPVMQQQTLFLDGCEANPWPYPNGAR